MWSDLRQEVPRWATRRQACKEKRDEPISSLLMCTVLNFGKEFKIGKPRRLSHAAYDSTRTRAPLA